VTTVSLPGADFREQSVRSRSTLVAEGLSVSAARSKNDIRTLVRDVSFRIAPGETLGLVGESGSGKSMTARAIVGLLPEDVRASGSVRFDGVEIVGARERALRRLRGSRISLLLQDPFTMLNPLQTAFQTVAESLPRAIRRDRRALRAEVERRLLEVGVDPAGAGRRYPFQLSGGIRQRVALAAALGRDPELLIADEPTTALDVTTQQEVLDLLRDLQRRRGMGLLLITHDLAIAFDVSDRVLVLYAGSVMEYGPSVSLVEQPAHPYTVRLSMANPPASHFVERLSAIPGKVPEADSVVNQCAFSDRCDWAAAICLTSHPRPRPVADDHYSACLRIDEIRAELSRKDAEVATQQRPRRTNPETGPILAVEGLRKSYLTVSLVGRARTTEAVREVSFHIEPHEAVGLVGESGSGKTSIARCVLGLTTPNAGHIRLAGIDISNYHRLGRGDLSRVRRHVQIVFQDPYASLNPRLSIGAALAEAVRARGDGAEPDVEVPQLLDLVGLPDHYATRRPKALSGGERQRIAIARAIAVQPELLVCDEPVASLDVSVQAQVLELLREIRRTRKMSVLFITHDLAVVRQMTERVIVLYNGEIVEEGATDAVLDNPTHPYTQRLLNSVIS
jgi:peptide/nickel transport system ATP-binding protein